MDMETEQRLTSKKDLVSPVNHPAARRRAIWVATMIVLLLCVGVLSCARKTIGNKATRSFADKLYVGYEKDIVLIPIYGDLKDYLHMAKIWMGIAPRWYHTYGLMRRILLTDSPSPEDISCANDQIMASGRS